MATEKLPVMDVGNENMKKMERELILRSLTPLAPLINAFYKDKIIFGDVEVPIGGPQ